jgi:hypothetical protein
MPRAPATAPDQCHPARALYGRGRGGGRAGRCVPAPRPLQTACGDSSPLETTRTVPARQPPRASRSREYPPARACGAGHDETATHPQWACTDLTRYSRAADGCAKSPVPPAHWAIGVPSDQPASNGSLTQTKGSSALCAAFRHLLPPAPVRVNPQSRLALEQPIIRHPLRQML